MLRIRKGGEIFRQYRKQRGIKFRPPKEYRPPRAKINRNTLPYIKDPNFKMFKFRLKNSPVRLPPIPIRLVKGHRCESLPKEPTYVPHKNPKVNYVDIKNIYKTPLNNLEKRIGLLEFYNNRSTIKKNSIIKPPMKLYANHSCWIVVSIRYQGTSKFYYSQTNICWTENYKTEINLFWKNKEISKIHLFLEYGQRPWMGIFVNKFYRSWRYEGFDEPTYYYARKKYINSGDALEPYGVIRSRKKTNPLDKKKRTWWRRNKKIRYIRIWWVHNRPPNKLRGRKIWLKKRPGILSVKSIGTKKLFLIKIQKKYLTRQKTKRNRTNLKKKKYFKTPRRSRLFELHKRWRVRQSQVSFFIKKKNFLKIKNLYFRMLQNRFRKKRPLKTKKIIFIKKLQKTKKKLKIKIIKTKKKNIKKKIIKKKKKKIKKIKKKTIKNT